MRQVYHYEKILHVILEKLCFLQCFPQDYDKNCFRSVNCVIPMQPVMFM